MSAAQQSDQIEPFRQGFVGYANVDGRQWRVLVRLRLEDEGWWRGCLWFFEAGGAQFWGQKEALRRRSARNAKRSRAREPSSGVRRLQDPLRSGFPGGLAPWNTSRFLAI